MKEDIADVEIHASLFMTEATTNLVTKSIRSLRRRRGKIGKRQLMAERNQMKAIMRLEEIVMMKKLLLKCV